MNEARDTRWRERKDKCCSAVCATANSLSANTVKNQVEEVVCLSVDCMFISFAPHFLLQLLQQ